jgi:hypothetical protein
VGDAVAPIKFFKPASPLGRCLEVFHPSRANVYAGYALTALFGFGGLALILWGLASLSTAMRLPLNSEERKAVGFNFLSVFPGLAVSLAAIAFGWYTRGVARCRVEFCEHGFRHWLHGTQAIDVFWVDVIRIEEQFIEDAVPPELSPMDMAFPPTVIRQFVVVHRDGRQFSFDQERVKRLGRLGTLLKEIASQKAIPRAVIKPEANA